jgi:streptogramin lyase
MDDTKTFLRTLDTIETPDQWDQIAPGVRGDADQGRQRLARLVVATASTILVTVGLIALLTHAFDASTPPATSQPPTVAPVEPVKLGAPVKIEPDTSQGITSMAASDGSLWVIGQFQEPGVEQLRRLDPSTGATQARFDLPVNGGGEWGGDGIVIGSGYVWATAWDSATVFRIDPADDSVTTFPLEGRVVSELAFDQITGDLWATIAGQADEGWRLVGLDPTDGREISSTSFSTDWSGGLLPAQGTVWQLGRHVKDSTVMGGFLHQLLPGIAPDVATGGSFSLPVTDGRWIWTAASGDAEAMNLASAIAQINPTDGAIVQTWDVGNIGYDIAVGADGGIWFLGGRGLERLNPSTGDVRSWDPTGDDKEEPVFVLPTRDGVWVGSYAGPLYFRPLLEG